MIDQPYINTRAHLAAMMLKYDTFASTYNADINAKRAAEPREQTKYQTLKPTHRAIFKDLILETGKKMLQNINNYQAINTEQGNNGTFKLLQSPMYGDGYYVCSTNRYQLSKHSKKEESTIYRNLLRLMDAGIIKTKIHHGPKSNFELHLNADFLIVSDKANPGYNPLVAVEKTQFLTESAPLPQRAECKEEKSVQEHLLNSIYSGKPESGQLSPANQDASKQAQGGIIGDNKPEIPAVNTTGSEQLPITGTVTGTQGKLSGFATDVRGAAKKANDNQPGGRVSVPMLLANSGIDYVKVFLKHDPEQWHAFHRLSHAAYFVDYLIQAIYAKRGVSIFPEVRIKAIEYAEKFYFPNPLQTDFKSIFKPCETQDQYAFRLEQLKWCVDAANRYAAKNNSFFVLISKYIDIDNVNGFKRTFTWWKEAKENEFDKARHLKNIKDLKHLHEKVRECAEGKTTLMAAENYIENHLPKYKYVFRHSLVTVINEIDKASKQPINQ